jgi:hypothetical protein
MQGDGQAHDRRQAPTQGPTVIGEPGRSARDKAADIRRAAEAWETGSAGEEVTAARLAGLPQAFFVLHDLHVPGSTANIDHLVVGPSGVWLIDTKSYRQPLRFAQGMVWRGKYPIRKELAAVEASARAVEAVLKAPVVSVLCFVDNAVPEGAAWIGNVALVSDHQVGALVCAPGPHPVDDVATTARLALTLRTPTPLPAHAPSGTSAPVSASAPPRRPEGRQAAAPSGKRVLAALMLSALAVIGSWTFIPGIASRVGQASTRLVSLPPTTTLVDPPATGPTIEAPTPADVLAILCVTAGAGWEAHFVWPTVVDAARPPAAYEVTSATAGVTVEPPRWLRGGTLPEPVVGLAPATPITLTVQGILADGTRLTPADVTMTTPATGC